MPSDSDNDSYENILTLTDGRQLAYSENGNLTSSTLVIFCHGLFGVGRASHVLPSFRDMDVHYLVPTMPGFGNSSPCPPSIPYVANLTSGIGQLIDHLYPNDSEAENLRIYVSGGSYGTVCAQMLYGVPFDVFPHGRQIVGCIIMAPFSPFRWHKDYAASMTWQNYISVGPPSQIIPYRLIPRMIAAALKPKFRSVEKADAMIRSLLFDKMTAEEKEAFKIWREKQGIEEGQFEREMAENAFKSVSKTWAGFIEGSDVLHGDWGFRPDQLDEEHSSRPILIAASTEDELGPAMAKWLAHSYRNAELKWVRGGHISSVYEMDEIWKGFFARTA